MPGELLTQPNPPPDPSLLPDSILEHGVHLDIHAFLPPDQHRAIHLFRRAANYISAGPHIPIFSVHSMSNLPFSHDLPQRQRPPRPTSLS